MDLNDTTRVSVSSQEMALSLHLTFISLPQKVWKKRFFLLSRTVFSTAQGACNQSQDTGKSTVARGIQFSSVAQSCPTLCDPMNCSTPGLPVHYHLPEFTQTHVHRVGDAIQPSHPLPSPFLLLTIPPSIRVFSNESTLHMRWPKYWSTLL